MRGHVGAGLSIRSCLVPWWSSQAPEAHRVKVGSCFWISRRSRSLSLRARSRATRASYSCDFRVCSCNGRISCSWFNNKWEDVILKAAADVIIASAPQPGSWHWTHCITFSKQVHIHIISYQSPDLLEKVQPNIYSTLSLICKAKCISEN